MRINLVTGPFLSIPPGAAGAVERRWRDVAEVFARRGHEVTIYCRRDEAVPRRNAPVRIRRIEGFTAQDKTIKNLPLDFVYSLRVLSSLEPADILVSNTFYLPLLARLRPSAGRVVVNVARVPKGQLDLYARFGVARFSAVSNAIAEEIQRQSPRAYARTKVIPNPIATSIFVPPEAARHNTSTEEKHIVYTGRIHPEKGLDILIKAFRKVAANNSALRLHLYGEWRVERGGGGEDFLNELKRLAEGLPIHFEAPISKRHELAAVLQQAHYYCYPSVAEKGESFGVAPLEAMGTGLPVVLSDLACFKDYLRDGENGLIFNHRAADPVAELAEKLERVISDQQLSQSLGLRAAETAATFSVENIADLYLEDFASLLR